MPGGHLSLKPKRVSETCFGSQPFDFAPSMAAGETILTQTVVSTVYQGTDPTPGSVISGAATVQTVTQVQQLFTAGVLGTIYELLCSVTTSLGQTLAQAAYLAIIPDLT